MSVVAFMIFFSLGKRSESAYDDLPYDIETGIISLNKSAPFILLLVLLL